MDPAAGSIAALAAERPRRLIVVTGKGGTGKTTVATALAVAARAAGRPATLVECQGRRDAVPMLAGLAPGRPRPDHASLVTAETLRLFLQTHLPPALGTLLLVGGGLEALVDAAPNLTQLLTVGRVWELSRAPGDPAGAPPVVVLDAPASGHGLALLASPRTYARAARAGPVHTQAAAIDADLHDPARTAVVLVTLAEPLAVSETIELRSRLRDELGIAVTAVVVNALLPATYAPDEVARVRTMAAARWRTVVLSAAARAGRQQVQLDRLRAELPDLPIIPLPFRLPSASPAAGRDAHRAPSPRRPGRPLARSAPSS